MIIELGNTSVKDLTSDLGKLEESLARLFNAKRFVHWFRNDLVFIKMILVVKMKLPKIWRIWKRPNWQKFEFTN